MSTLHANPAVPYSILTYKAIFASQVMQPNHAVQVLAHSITGKQAGRHIHRRPGTDISVKPRRQKAEGLPVADAVLLPAADDAVAFAAATGKLDRPNGSANAAAAEAAGAALKAAVLPEPASMYC